jgi:hypothetical protein
VRSGCSACCSQGVTALIPPCCCHPAAHTGTPTNDRAGGTRTRAPGGAPVFLTVHAARPPCPSLAPPGVPHPLDGTESDRKLLRRFRERMPDQAAWTGGIVVESCPPPGLVSVRALSSSTHVWTRGGIWGALGEMPASILRKAHDGIVPQSAQCLFFILRKSAGEINNCQTVSGVRASH